MIEYLEVLYALALMLNDDGSINFNITSKTDWNANLNTMFKALQILDSHGYPYQAIVTKNLEDFIQFNCSNDE